MIGVRVKGDFRHLTDFLNQSKNLHAFKFLEHYGEIGVAALRSVTPTDTGLTANSWRYEIVRTDGTVKLIFLNSNVQNGVPIAVILQYGHATGGGGWIEGRDYINPALQPIFDQIAEDAWKEITKR